MLWKSVKRLLVMCSVKVTSYFFNLIDPSTSIEELSVLRFFRKILSTYNAFILTHWFHKRTYVSVVFFFPLSVLVYFSLISKVVVM